MQVLERPDPGVSHEGYGITLMEQELASFDRSRRMVAQMLEMVGAAMPLTSASAEPVDRHGFRNGPSIVHQTATLRVTPQELRREYRLRYELEDPFHAREVADTSATIRGTHECGFGGLPRDNPFFEYVREVDLPHFLRLFFRMDGVLCGYLFLGRTHAQGPFSERELTFLRRSHPFLESAYVSAKRPAPKVESEEILVRAGLTARESEVARYAATGLRSEEIADLLVLTEATVKTHLSRIYRKLAVRSKAELAARLRPCEV
jgi:DNA-binding CsgD family transcriptional regulator